jgi:hypothetical protein
VCTDCLQTRGSSHEESDADCIGIPLAAIFQYVVGGRRGASTGQSLEYFGG